MRMHRVTPFLCVALTVTACVLIPTRPVMAERTPTDIELRAAYCRALLATNLNQAQQRADHLLQDLRSSNGPIDRRVEKKLQEALLLHRQAREKTERNLRRFDLYLVPRLHELDLLQLIIADKRGEEDSNSLLSDATGCTQSCRLPASNYENCSEACFRNKGLYALSDRIKSCQSPTWLPF